jgi:hypothetical protein
VQQHQRAKVDLLFLSRDLSPPRKDVWKGVEGQEGVDLRVIRVTGPPQPGDADSIATIVRARNASKRAGSTPFVMLVDDDVVLGPRCVARLVEGLRKRPQFAALAADSAGEMRRGWDHWDYPRHVGMAAVLFRRERLEALTFRSESDKCECRCCCEDLRRAGHAIGYLPGAEAWHRPLRTNRATSCAAFPSQSAESSRDVTERASAAGSTAPALPGRVLSTFDRKHRRLFVRRFLRSFRREGNTERVTAVVSGLYPSERRSLATIPGVEVFVAPNDGHPCRQRLRNFQQVIAGWPEDTPVAYWDAGDIVFQDRIAPLWDLVRANPDRLLAVTEVIPFRDSTGARRWVERIHDREARRWALDLLMERPLINGGFAAGTVKTMLRYLKAADQILRSPALKECGDWGDQTAMNLYCHSNPHTWLEIPAGWNFCLVGLEPSQYRVSRDGRTERLDRAPLHVVHGAAGSLKHWDLVHLTA